MGRVFWVKVDRCDDPVKFDYDRDDLAKGYPSFDSYFRSFIDGWEDGKGNPCATKYVLQDDTPDDKTVWLDGGRQHAVTENP